MIATTETAILAARLTPGTVLLADGSTIGTPAGSTQREFSDPGATLALRNPETGALTGQTITHGELYAILWSLAMESAALADAAASASSLGSAGVS